MQKLLLLMPHGSCLNAQVLVYVISDPDIGMLSIIE